MSDEAPLSSDYSFTAPTLEELSSHFASYELQAIIAQGGMGAVYHAIQTSLDRHVAIKILPREIGKNRHFREAFFNEAKAMAKLNHPNLVSVYDSGEADGMPYIIMEYVAGQTMHEATHQKQIDEELAKKITINILKGISHAHNNGVVHRDIKPANIILNHMSSPKITDFGLTGNVKHQGQMLGTPGYAAPEIIKNPEHIDYRTDLFAIGVVLHELLTGIPPTGSTKLRSAAGIVRCNPKLDTIIQRATHPIMDMRYSSAQEMINDLEALVSDTTSGPKLVTSSQQAQSPAKQALDTPSIQTQSAAHYTGEQKKSNTLRNLIILAAIACCSAIAYDQLKKEQDKQATSTSIDEYVEAQESLSENTEKEKRIAAIRESESQLESLKRLKRKLISGSKDEFPKGSVLTKKSAYFFVEESMNWHQAQEFAEEHGGHLAVANNQEAKEAISQILQNNERAWLGGSMGYWSNGDEWGDSIKEETRFTGQAISFGTDGILKSASINEPKPFIIEWPLQGSNAGSLAVQFRRTKEKASEDSYYPPGTIALGKKRFFLVPRSVQWNTAKNLAASSGGQLAQPSNEEEIELLSLYASSFLNEKDTKFWIGANNSNDAWSWSDGNLIDGGNIILDYLPNKPVQDSAVAIGMSNKRKNLTTESQKEKVSGFIVEWTSTVELPNKYLTKKENTDSKSPSEPHSPSNLSDPTVVKDPPKSFTELKNKAASLVAEYRKSHNTELQKLKTSLEQDKESIIRSIPVKDRKKAEDFCNDILLELKLGGKPPLSIPGDIHSKAHSLLKRTLDKQKRLNQQYTQRLNNLHTHYSKNLKLEAVKTPTLAFFFSDELTAIGDSGTSLDQSFGAYDEIIESTKSDSEANDADKELQELLDSL